MKRALRVTIALGNCAAALIAGAAWADTNPFVGRWHLNRTQSTLPSSEPAATDLSAEISRGDDQHLTWLVTIVTSDGQSQIEIVVRTFDAATNGVFHPISNDTTAAFRLTGDALQATLKGPSGRSGALTCGVSANQNKMICKGIVDDGNGHTANYVEVYDRR